MSDYAKEWLATMVVAVVLLVVACYVLAGVVAVVDLLAHALT